MAHLDRAGRYGIGGLKAGYDFACSKDLNFEVAAGCIRHVLGEIFGTTVNGIKRLRERRRQAPGHLRHFLRDGRCGQHGGRGGACTGDTGFLDK